ncbi:hypothetical protein GCM10007148_26240 [Parvularcula lutaonensis]|nr:hypothetical protein GCM10007148_26240 [Parvularcula lutaonensis]
MPLPPEQAKIAIEIVGEYFKRFRKPLPKFEAADFAILGLVDLGPFDELFHDLKSRGVVTGFRSQSLGVEFSFSEMALTVSGWDVFDEIVSGRVTASRGFIAMKFNDDTLEQLVAAHIKPAIKNELSRDLVDTRDDARAGIIDNLMRQLIRDSAFVIVDLTHDNAGAYWEAGYAEGLGKPVIYICEAGKFAQAQTHFDTNHSTTVLWESGSEDNFVAELIATIRRSIGDD